MTRIRMARCAIALALTAAGLVTQSAPAGAVADRGGAPPVRAAIAGGGSHSCTLSSNGTVKCWGYNA